MISFPAGLMKSTMYRPMECCRQTSNAPVACRAVLAKALLPRLSATPGEIALCV
jgi:hypothetical protein